MIAVVLAMLGIGVAAGLALRGRPRALSWADRGLTGSIYFFLFVLGMMVGANRETLAHLHQLGLQSLLIALAGVAGSVTAAVMLSRYVLKDSDLEE